MAQKSAGIITLKFEALTKGLEKGFGEAKKQANEFGNGMGAMSQKLGAVGGVVTATGVGMVALGGSILAGANMGKQAFDIYGQGIAEISSLIPNTGDRIKELDTELRGVSKSLGIMPKEATAGLYNLISAFGDSEDTMKIFEINTKAAKAGVATLSDSIALTSAVTKTYGDTSAEAQSKATDLAFTAVKLGQTTFPELAGSIGAVTPLAKELTVSQEELFAVMGAQTGVTGNASEVTTQFRGALQGLMAPTSQMTKLMSTLGYENGQAMVQNLGFKGSLEAITNEAKKTGKPLQDYLGSIEAQTLALSLSGANGEKYNQTLAEMQGATGATSQAFNDLTSGAGESAQETAEMQAQLEFAKIAMGEALLPITLETTQGITGLVNSFTSFVEKNPGVMQAILVLGGVLTGVGVVLTTVGGFIMFVSGVMSGLATIATTFGVTVGAVATPIGWVILAITALIAIGVFLWQNWDWISQKAGEVWDWISTKTSEGFNNVKNFVGAGWSWVSNKFNQGVNWVKTTASNGWDNITGFFTNGINKAKSSVDRGVGGIKNTFKSGMDFISGLISPVINQVERLGNLASGLKNKVGGGLSSLKGAVSGFRMPGFANGGVIGDRGIPIQASNGDNRLIAANSNEAVVNPKQAVNILDKIMNGGDFGNKNSAGNTKIEIYAQDSESFEKYMKKNAFSLKKILKLA